MTWLFDKNTAKTNRDEAMTRVQDHAPDEWKEMATEAVRAMIEAGRPFTTDDVLSSHPELEACPEKRLLGPIMMMFSKAGQIRPGGYKNSSRTVSHARPKRIWIP